MVKTKKVGLAFDHLESSEDDPTCMFCGLKRSNVVFEQDDTFHNKENIRAHHWCMLFSANLAPEDDDYHQEPEFEQFSAEGVMKELKRISKLACSYCHKKGAGMGCAEKKCKRNYHFQCGIEDGALARFSEDYRCYCKKHRPYNKLNDDVLKTKCPFCDEGFEIEPEVDKAYLLDKFDAVLLNCCRDVLAHVACVVDKAKQSKNRLKCPFCERRREKFVRQLLEQGIFVEDYDKDDEKENAAIAAKWKDPGEKPKSQEKKEVNTNPEEKKEGNTKPEKKEGNTKPEKEGNTKSEKKEGNTKPEKKKEGNTKPEEKKEGTTRKRKMMEGKENGVDEDKGRDNSLSPVDAAKRMRIDLNHSPKKKQAAQNGSLASGSSGPRPSFMESIKRHFMTVYDSFVPPWKSGN